MAEENDPIAAALAHIPDPCGRGSLAEAGRITMTRLKEGKAVIMIEATGLCAEQRAGLERQVRAAMIGVPGVAETQIAMTAEQALNGRSSRSAPARAASASPPFQPISPWRLAAWARRSGWSTPTFTAPPSPGSWARARGPSWSTR